MRAPFPVILSITFFLIVRRATKLVHIHHIQHSYRTFPAGSFFIAFSFLCRGFASEWAVPCLGEREKERNRIATQRERWITKRASTSESLPVKHTHTHTLALKEQEKNEWAEKNSNNSCNRIIAINGLKTPIHKMLSCSTWRVEHIIAAASFFSLFNPIPHCRHCHATTDMHFDYSYFKLCAKTHSIFISFRFGYRAI